MLTSTQKILNRLTPEALVQSPMRKLVPYENIAGNKVRHADKDLLCFANTDFLNLALHPDVAKSFVATFEQVGFGSASARLSAGTHQLHLRAEHRLANFLGLEDALIFSSRSQACISLLSALVNETDLLLYSEESESPLSDLSYLLGCSTDLYHNIELKSNISKLANIAGLKILHLDACHLSSADQTLLTSLVAPGSDIIDALLIDESLTLGSTGLRGAGLNETLLSAKDQLFLYGDLGATFAINAGFLAGSKALINQIKNSSRVLNLERATALPALAAFITALDLCEQMPNQRLLLQQSCTNLFEHLKPICTFAKIKRLSCPGIKLTFSNLKEAKACQQALLDQNILLAEVNYSGVQNRHYQLRIFLNTQHTEKDLFTLIAAIEKFNKRSS